MIQASTDAVVHQVEYAHPVDLVWRELTDSDAISEWAFADGGIVDGFKPEVGTRFSSWGWVTARPVSQDRVRRSCVPARD